MALMVTDFTPHGTDACLRVRSPLQWDNRAGDFRERCRFCDGSVPGGRLFCELTGVRIIHVKIQPYMMYVQNRNFPSKTEMLYVWFRTTLKQPEPKCVFSICGNISTCKFQISGSIPGSQTTTTRKLYLTSLLVLGIFASS